MADIKDGQAVVTNPYVTQADKFAVSLRHLADTFLTPKEPRAEFTEDELEEIFQKIDEKVCRNCEQRSRCQLKEKEALREMISEILRATDKYGEDLNVELKRNLQKKCAIAPRFLRETMNVFQDAKTMLLWNNKMAQNRTGCAVQLDAFAHVIQHAVRELNASIFTDPPLEKKLKLLFKKNGIRMLSSVFFVNAHGRYEIHVTIRTEKGSYVTTKMVARIISRCTRRVMCPAEDERPVVGMEYSTVTCVEGPAYYTLQGIAKIGKGCEKISGDNFLMTRLPGGEEAAILSDGMGTGEKAFRESAMMVEMLEELLKAGFPCRTALSMMNTALVMGREEVCFSTVDMCKFDLYTAKCSLIKAGAAVTFIRRRDRMEHIYSESLPIGVVPGQEAEEIHRKLESGDMVIMVTDGVLDALPSGEEEHLLDLIIMGTTIENPCEMAHYILQKVLELSSSEPADDMTVLVAGIWQICYNERIATSAISNENV